MSLTLPDNSSLFDNLLIQYSDYIHSIIHDINSCKFEDIRKTSVHDIEPILNLFIGSTLKHKRDTLIEFLKIMPEYKTLDQNVLYQRLKALQDYIKQTEGTSDLYYYALRKYGNENKNEEEQQEE